MPSAPSVTAIAAHVEKDCYVSPFAVPIGGYKMEVAMRKAAKTVPRPGMAASRHVASPRTGYAPPYGAPSAVSEAGSTAGPKQAAALQQT